MQDVNLKSVYLCSRAALRHMVPQGRGSIINTASFVALLGSATSQISYTASKGGVLAMTRELGVQFARQGIRVNALCPGPVNTPLLQELFAKDPERAQRRLVHVPMGRFAEPEELAAAVAFLASDDASFITATAFVVDGGITNAYVTPALRRSPCAQLLTFVAESTGSWPRRRPVARTRGVLHAKRGAEGGDAMTEAPLREVRRAVYRPAARGQRARRHRRAPRADHPARRRRAGRVAAARARARGAGTR